MTAPDSPPDTATSNVRPESKKILDAVSSTPHIPAATEKPWSLQSALANLPNVYRSSQSPSPLPFLHLLERLKTTKREGWRRFGITSGESIADHMYRMSVITMLAPPSLSSRLDIPHCTKMALVHDMAELLVGDITPMDGVPKAEKKRREAETMEYLCCGGKGMLGEWGDGEQGKGIRAIFREYEESRTLESLFVHDVDKMELLLQMVEYEKRGKGQLDLGEFTRVAQRIHLKEMKEWCQEVLRERVEFWKGLGKEASMLDMTATGDA
ncbi:HD domain-containing protein [Usnea florida]